MGDHQHSRQGSTPHSQGPTAHSLRNETPSCAMLLDPTPSDPLPPPEECGHSMQYGTAGYGGGSRSNDETSGSGGLAGPESVSLLKTPLKRDTYGPLAAHHDPHAGPVLYQQPSGGLGSEIDVPVDQKYATNAYESVFPRDDPALSPTWNMPGSFKVFSAMDLDTPHPPYTSDTQPPVNLHLGPGSNYSLESQNTGYPSLPDPGHSDTPHFNPSPSDPNPFNHSEPRNANQSEYPNQTDYQTGYQSYQSEYPNQSDQPQFNPDMNSFNHDVNSYNHNQNSYNHNQNSFNPDSNSFNPDSNSFNPDSNSLNPDSNSFNPDLSNLALDPNRLDNTPAFSHSVSHSIAESPYSTDRSPQQYTPSTYALPAATIGADTSTEPPGFSDSALAPDLVSFLSEQNATDAQSSALRDLASNRTSISLAANELSPLTTTTSFTASVSSYHSTQQSFFSAQQYWRTSMDVPPSSIHRASMDLYQRRRGSLESSNSGANAPARSQRSLASYFPFMDKDRKSPISNPSPPADWSPAMGSASRHSIRSIFKTSNAPQSVDEEPERTAFWAKNDDDHLDADDAQKKAKRTTRGLFKRFKQTRQEEMKPEDALRFEEMGSVSSNQSDVQLGNLGAYEEADLEDEPDYGALFSKVGKRKNFVMKNSKKDKDKAEKEREREKEKEKGFKNEPPIKMEELAAPSFSSAENSESSHLSASTSGMSSTSRETAEAGATSSFASASKRILGSRLMKKKNQIKNEPLTNVVEIDLQSLDLPENTEVIEKQTSKSRTRGRKEDKAADLEDDSKIYICGYCSRRFKRQEHLKRHFRSLHTAEKPYNCSYCKKKFSRTDNLNQHVKVHKQEGENL